MCARYSHVLYSYNHAVFTINVTRYISYCLHDDNSDLDIKFWGKMKMVMTRFGIWDLGYNDVICYLFKSQTLEGQMGGYTAVLINYMYVASYNYNFHGCVVCNN